MSINKRRLMLNKQRLLIFLLILPALKPESFNYVFLGVNRLYNLFRFVSLAIVIVLYLSKRKIPSPMVLIIAVLQGWIALTTYMNHGDTTRALYNLIFTMIFVSVIDLFPMHNVIPALFCNFEWIIYVNLFTLILMPGGLYHVGVHGEFTNYFLGSRNSFFVYCIVAILLAGLYYIQTEKRFRPILMVIVSFASVIIGWSVTSMISLSVAVFMFLSLIILKKPKFVQKIRFNQLFVFSIILDVLISVFNFIQRLGFVNNIITNVLHKQTTLSGRTVIWELAVKMIYEKPLVGYGVGEHISWAGYNWYGHNHYYQMLLEGGLPCIVLFVIILFMVSRRLENCDNHLVYNAFIVAFSGLFIYYIAEAGTGMIFFVIYALAYKSIDFCDGIEYSRQKNNQIRGK